MSEKFSYRREKFLIDYRQNVCNKCRVRLRKEWFHRIDRTEPSRILAFKFCDKCVCNKKEAMDAAHVLDIMEKL